MIRVEQLTKKFGMKTVLHGVSFEIGETGVYALIGRNGVGKTTLLRILAGLEKKTAGSVQLPPDCRIAYVFQDLRLVPTLTALENLTLVLPRERRGEAMRALTAVGLAQEAELLPGKLSGGMRQRLAIARALCFESDLLLLDEPFSALDEEWRLRVTELIRAYAAKRPVLLVTHSAEDRERLNAQSIIL